MLHCRARREPRQPRGRRVHVVVRRRRRGPPLHVVHRVCSRVAPHGAGASRRRPVPRGRRAHGARHRRARHRGRRRRRPHRAQLRAALVHQRRLGRRVGQVRGRGVGSGAVRDRSLRVRVIPFRQHLGVRRAVRALRHRHRRRTAEVREVEPVLRVGRHARRPVGLARRVEAEEAPVARAPPAAPLVGVRRLVRAPDAVVAGHRGDHRLDVPRTVGRERAGVRRRRAAPEQALLRRREQEVVRAGRRQNPARERREPAQRILHRRHAGLHVRERRRRVLPRHRQRLQALPGPRAGFAPPAQLHLRQPQPALRRPFAIQPVLAHLAAVQAHRQPVQAQPLPLRSAADRHRVDVAAPRVLEHHLGVAAVPVHDALRMPRAQRLRLPVLVAHLVAERVRLPVDRPQQRHRHGRRAARHQHEPQLAVGRVPVLAHPAVRKLHLEPRRRRRPPHRDPRVALAQRPVLRAGLQVRPRRQHQRLAVDAQPVRAVQADPVRVVGVAHAAPDRRQAADPPAVAQDVARRLLVRALPLAPVAVVDRQRRLQPVHPRHHRHRDVHVRVAALGHPRPVRHPADRRRRLRPGPGQVRHLDRRGGGPVARRRARLRARFVARLQPVRVAALGLRVHVVPAQTRRGDPREARQRRARRRRPPALVQRELLVPERYREPRQRVVARRTRTSLRRQPGRGRLRAPGRDGEHRPDGRHGRRRPLRKRPPGRVVGFRCRGSPVAPDHRDLLVRPAGSCRRRPAPRSASLFLYRCVTASSRLRRWPSPSAAIPGTSDAA